MVGQCMVCLSEHGELWSSCAPGTCHNLMIHPRCYADLRSKSSDLTCPICDNPYAITVVRSKLWMIPYVRSWSTIGALVAYSICGAVLVLGITAVGLHRLEYISFCLCAAFALIFITFLVVCHNIHKAFGVHKVDIYTSRNGRKYRLKLV